MSSRNIRRAAKGGGTGLRKFRLYWLVIPFFAIGLWSYTDLSISHFAFFAVLSCALYWSYSREILPLAIYFTAMMLYWVIVPVIQKDFGVGFYISRGYISDFSSTALAFCITHFLGIFVGHKFGYISTGNCVPSRSKFSVIGVIFGLSVLLLMIAILGFDTIFSSRINQRAAALPNYLIFLRNLSKLLPAILLSYMLLEGSKNSRQKISLVGVFLLVLILFIVANPVNTSRFLSMFGLLVVTLVYIVRFSKQAYFGFAVAAAPFYAIFLLGITSSMRTGFNKLDFGTSFRSLQTLEFSSYSIFVDALRIENLPHTNYLMSHLMILVPRKLWPDKAGSIGIAVAERADYVYSNVGLNAFFNSFADFGFLGLFLFSVAFGVLVRNLNPFRENVSFLSRRFMYAIFFTASTPMFFRGDLSTAMLAFYPSILAYEMVRFATRLQLPARFR